MVAVDELKLDVIMSGNRLNSLSYKFMNKITNGREMKMKFVHYKEAGKLQWAYVTSSM